MTAVRAYWGLVLLASTFGLAGAQAQPAAEPGAVYAYTDDRGALVHVQRLQDVPLNLRHAVTRVDVAAQTQAPVAKTLHDWLIAASSGSAAAPVEPVMYSYTGVRGQVVYTNLPSSVPLNQREHARIDLRKVSLNSEVGKELNGQLEQRFQALRASEACTQLRAAADESFWERAWRDYRVYVICGGVLLLLLLAAPWMHSKGWGTQWSRVLFTAVPMLAFVALSTSVLMKANAMRSNLLPRAERCDPKAFEGAKDLPNRFGLVSALESEQRALAAIDREMPRQ